MICLAGVGQVESVDVNIRPMRFMKGEALFIPAGIGKCMIVGNAELIKARC